MSDSRQTTSRKKSELLWIIHSFRFLFLANDTLVNDIIAFRYVSDESASGRISGRHTTMGEGTLIPSLLTMNLQSVHKITSLIRLLLYIYIHRYLFLLH